MQRIYRKQVNGKQLMRWETEYKDRLSQAIWEKLLETGEAVLSSALLAEMERLPHITAFAPIYNNQCGVAEVIRFTKDRTDTHKRLLWFERCVIPALRKVVRDTMGDSQEERALREWAQRLVGEQFGLASGYAPYCQMLA
jgi:hypothetical protein